MARATSRKDLQSPINTWSTRSIGLICWKLANAGGNVRTPVQGNDAWCVVVQLGKNRHVILRLEDLMDIVV